MVQIQRTINELRGVRIGQMTALPSQPREFFCINQITSVKSLFLKGETPEQIARSLNKSVNSINSLIKRLIKTGQIKTEIPLTKITTEFLNSLINSPYQITKVFGKGWIISENNVIILELGSYPYSAYKQVLSFNKNIKGE